MPGEKLEFDCEPFPIRLKKIRFRRGIYPRILPNHQVLQLLAGNLWQLFSIRHSTTFSCICMRIPIVNSPFFHWCHRFPLRNQAPTKTFEITSSSFRRPGLLDPNPINSYSDPVESLELMESTNEKIAFHWASPIRDDVFQKGWSHFASFFFGPSHPVLKKQQFWNSSTFNRE